MFSSLFLHQLTCVFSLAVRLYPAPKPICRRRVPERPDYLAPPAAFVGVTLSWRLLHWFEVSTITCRVPYKTCTSSGSIYSLQAGRQMQSHTQNAHTVSQRHSCKTQQESPKCVATQQAKWYIINDPVRRLHLTHYDLAF